jgi:hypothetical protein
MNDFGDFTAAAPVNPTIRRHCHNCHNCHLTAKTGSLRSLLAVRGRHRPFQADKNIDENQQLICLKSDGNDDGTVLVVIAPNPPHWNPIF